MPIAVIEGDQQTSNDAERIRATGAPAIQINTGKGCHLDAHMVGHALETLDRRRRIRLLFIENVGNLVCPAGFDLGEAHKVVVLSVTEGEDKPLKYPDMFAAADLMLLNKSDLLPHLDFDVGACLANALRVNPRPADVDRLGQDRRGPGGLRRLDRGLRRAARRRDGEGMTHDARSRRRANAAAPAPARARRRAGRRLPAVRLRPRDAARRSRGFVRNDAEGVLIEVEGAERRAVRRRRLRREPPPLARIDCDRGRRAVAPRGGEGFVIDATRPGGRTTAHRRRRRVCEECLAELFDPTSRFYRYPLVNCTHCGPRYTLTRAPALRPRRRPRWRAFAMCADCARDYADPANRRFHAEPIACPRCGPKLNVAIARDRRLPARRRRSSRSRASAAIICSATRATRRRSRGCAGARSARPSRSR